MKKLAGVDTALAAVRKHPLVALASTLVVALATLGGALQFVRSVVPDTRGPAKIEAYVDTPKAAGSLFDELVAHVNRQVELEVTLTADVVDDVSQGLAGEAALDPAMEWLALPAPGDADAESFQINVAGLAEDYLPTRVGWGTRDQTGASGWAVYGRYRVVSTGIGTGGVAWVALQALRLDP
jgi:hypothetical protein